MKESILNKFDEVLHALSEDEIETFNTQRNAMLSQLKEAFTSNKPLHGLIGNNGFDKVFKIYRKHLDFMRAMFELRSSSLLFDNIIWFYTLLISRGYQEQFLLLNTQLIQQQVKTFNPNSKINALYETMLRNHQFFLEVMNYPSKLRVKEEYKEVYEPFLETLIDSKSYEALEISKSFIKSSDDIRIFWQEIIMPALYEIGHLWNRNYLNVANEHMATALCQRIMSYHYAKVLGHVGFDNSIIVASTMHELHEVGGRMLSDFLELKGFNVYFMGSDVPIDSILETIENHDIDVVALSTTIPSHLLTTKGMISDIKAKFPTVRVYVGGQAYQPDESLYEYVGADAYAKTPEEFASLVNQGGCYD